jgi:hypothetical protein
VLAETPIDFSWYPTIQLQVPEPFTAPGAELAIEGCGASTRIALPDAPPPAPVTTDLTTDGEYIYWGWTSPTPPTGVLSNYSIGVGAHGCQHIPTATIAIEIPWTSTRGTVHIATAIDEGTTPTPWGEARIWSTNTGEFLPLVIPTPPVLPGGAWSHPSDGATITIDGVPAGSASWRFRELADNSWRHELDDICVEYVAGETTDTLRVCTVDGVYSGSFPHVAPTNELEFGTSGDRTFALSIGQITLAREDDPSITRPFTLTATIEHEIIPRPEAAPP